MQNVPAVAVPLDPLASNLTYSIERVALAYNQALAFLGFSPYAILFSLSWINNPDPHMFVLMKKDFMALVHGWGSTVSRRENYFEEQFTFYH